MLQNFVYQYEKIINAPKDKVWEAFADGDIIQQWYGPQSCVLIHKSFDFSNDGHYLHAMQMPNGGDMWNIWQFQHIVPKDSFSFLMAMCDENGENISRPSWNPSWPIYLLVKIVIENDNDNSKIILSCQAYDATAEEEKTFQENAAMMEMGWASSFEKLAQLFS